MWEVLEILRVACYTHLTYLRRSQRENILCVGSFGYKEAERDRGPPVLRKFWRYWE